MAEQQEKEGQKSEDRKGGDRKIKTLPGERLDLRMGQELLVRFSSESGNTKTVFVGMIPYEFLVARLPRVAGITDHAGRGTTLTVRYLQEGSIYGFSTESLGFVLKPVPTLFMAPPNRLEVIDLRACPRVETSLPVEGVVGQEEFKGVIRDLSCGGMRVEIADSGQAKRVGRLEDEDVETSVAFKLGRDGDMIAVRGKILNTHRETGKLYFAMVFDDGQKEYLQRIDDYTGSLLEEGRESSIPGGSKKQESG